MNKTAWTFAGCYGLLITVGAATAQVPQFEPDPLWSQALPNKWVTGAGRRHRRRLARQRLGLSPRRRRIPDGEKAASLKPPQAECCIPAPAVLEFGPAGTFLQAWGGPGAGYEWFTTEHGIFVDAQGQRLAERQREGRQPDPEVHEQGQVPDADRPRRQEQRQQRHREPRRPGGPVRLPENQRAVRRRRLLQPPRHRLRRGHRRLQAPLGRLRQEARGRLQVPASRAADPGPSRRRSSTTPCTPCSCRTTISSTSPIAPTTGSRSSGSTARSSRKSFIARNTLQAEGTVHNFAMSPDKAQQFLYVRRRLEQGGPGAEPADAGDRRRTSAGTPDTTRASSSTRTASPPTRRATSSSAKSTTASGTTGTRSPA